ncbi:MAG: sensor histidine kinase, partial [Ruminiclostridium sp.]
AFKKISAYSYFSKPNNFPQIDSKATFEEKSNLTYYGEYLNRQYHKIGYIATNINRESMFFPINKLSEETFGTTYIINEYNTPIYHYGKDSAALSQIDLSVGTPSGQKITLNGEQYVLFVSPITHYQRWRLVGLVSYTSLLDKVKDLIALIILISLIAFVLVIILSITISSKITTPIRMVCVAMNELGKNRWPGKIKNSSADEMNQLVCGFNQMVENMHALTDQNIKQQSEIRVNEVSMIKTQLDLLQSQINPHFIYNTLNTVKYMAIKSNNTEISNVIGDFSLLLHASMSINVNFVTVYEELQYVLSYINIQRFRYDESIQLDYEIDEESKYALIPKLVLQPIVENALFHGILPKHGGLIKIEIRKTSNTVHISVSDNGVGIPQATLNNILTSQIPNRTGYSKIGLNNVNDRLVLYYSTQSNLKIYSEEGSGTKIEFQIPYSA